MGLKKPEELGACHECGKQVSFSAAACPHCGSREPFGRYISSRRKQRLHRIEERNDQTLVAMTVLCTGIGVFFGAMTAGWMAAIGYGVIGAIIGVPGAFIINMTRHMFD
jgi:hypothetical protein